MLKFIFLMLLSVPCFADEWTDADTAREATYLAFHAMDWAQTRNGARDPAHHIEHNPILGKHPSVGRVDAYFVTNALLHVAISKWLPPSYRHAYQYVTIGGQIGVVATNLSFGVNIKF